MAVAQIIVSAITTFILYKYLLDIIGVESLGIWSVVIATTSISTISQFGLSGSVTKFVAKYLAKKEEKKVENVLKTALVSIGGILLIVLPLVYYPLAWILSNVIATDSLESAILLLPYALISMWFSSLSSVVISGLDGCQRIDLRSSLMIAGVIIFTSVSIALIPSHGLLGLAYAQIMQNIFVLTLGWSLMRRNMSSLPLIPIGWNYDLFKEMIRYGINFQIGSIAMMLFEPMAKVLMSKFGGLVMTGYFEMANRMILQFRSVAVAANQVLVPVIATLQERCSIGIKELYIKTFSLVLVLSLAWYGFAIVITPYVSEILLGYYEPKLIFFAFMSTLGWGINTLSSPAYFNNLGTGELFWNTMSYVIMGAVNILMGCLLGYCYGENGVIAAYVIALSIGSCTTIIMYHIKHEVMLIGIFDSELIKVFIACVIGCLSGLFIYYLPRTNDSLSLYMLLLLSVTLYITSAFLSLKHNIHTNQLITETLSNLKRHK